MMYISHYELYTVLSRVYSMLTRPECVYIVNVYSDIDNHSI